MILYICATDSRSRLYRDLSLPGYTAGGLYKADTERNLVGVHNSATNDEIVGGYFEVEFAFGEFDFCKLDSCPCVGKIDYRARETPAVIQDDLGWFKYLPPPELPSLWLLLYRQIALDRKSFCCTNLHTPEEYNFLCYLPTFSCCIRILCYSVFSRILSRSQRNWVLRSKFVACR